MLPKMRMFAILRMMSTPKIPALGLYVINSKMLWFLSARRSFLTRQRLGAILSQMGFSRILIKLLSIKIELRSKKSFFRMIEPTVYS